MSKKDLGVPYAAFSRAFAEETMGGRFGALSRTIYVGAEKQAAYGGAPNWAPDYSGKEPPLGMDINAQAAVGTAKEILKSTLSHAHPDDVPGAGSLPHRDPSEGGRGDVASAGSPRPQPLPLVERLNSSRSVQLPDAQSASGPFKRRV